MNKIKSVFDISNPKTRTIILIIGAVGLLIMLISSFKPASKKTETAQIDESSYNEHFIEENEKKLTEIISSISGVGEVRLMITLESGVQTIYKCRESIESDSGDDRQSFSSESDATIISTDEGDRPLTIMIIEPTVKGVAIVCSGGDNPVVREMVTNTVCKSLGVSANRVSVAKLAK